MAFAYEKAVVAVKLEATPGIAETDMSAAMNFRCKNLSFPMEMESYILEGATSKHSVFGAVAGARMLNGFGFVHDLQLGAAAGTAPTANAVLGLCGLKETIVADTSVAYTPNQDVDEATYTVWFYLNASAGNSLIIKAKGCKADGRIFCDRVGTDPLSLEVTGGMGALYSIVDGSGQFPASFNTTKPPQTLGATITSASQVQQISSLELAFGNTVVLEGAPADGSGFSKAQIVKREIRLRYNPITKLRANDGTTASVTDRWLGGTSGAFSLATAASGGLKWTLSAPNETILTAPITNADGLSRYTVESVLGENTGNDSFQLLQSA